MLTSTQPLEKQIEQLQSALFDREQTLASFQTQVTSLTADVATREAKITALTQSLQKVTFQRDLYKEQLIAKMHALFAAKSEARHNPGQGDLFFNEAELGASVEQAATDVATSADADANADAASILVAAHSKKKPGRKPLDPHLPREVVRIELPESERICPVDGAVLVEIGVEVSEQLDIVPAQVKVLRTERVKYACPVCDETIRTAPVTPKMIPKGLLTDHALAWVVTSKYQDGLPLYRQANLLQRFGGDIARNTLATSMVTVGLGTQPIIHLLRDYLLHAPLVYMDETRLQVLNEKGRAAQARSQMWVQACGGGDPNTPSFVHAIRLFTYDPSRSAACAERLLEGFEGVLMTDGYKAYDAVIHRHPSSPTSSSPLIHLACWAHARRGFVKAENALTKKLRSRDHPSSQMLRLIGQLYHLEKPPADQPAYTEAQRLVVRQEKSRSVIAQIEQLLLAHLHNTAPKSELGKALHYLQGQWPKLIRFLDHGQYPLDNNLAENAIRPFVVGRKGWLFSDSVKGAQASANLYSLIETAKACGIEPYHYLCRLFQKLPLAQTLEDLEALLPWNLSLN